DAVTAYCSERLASAKMWASSRPATPPCCPRPASGASPHLVVPRQTEAPGWCIGDEFGAPGPQYARETVTPGQGNKGDSEMAVETRVLTDAERRQLKMFFDQTRSLPQLLAPPLTPPP